MARNNRQQQAAAAPAAQQQGQQQNPQQQQQPRQPSPGPYFIVPHSIADNNGNWDIIVQVMRRDNSGGVQMGRNPLQLTHKGAVIAFAQTNQQTGIATFTGVKPVDASIEPLIVVGNEDGRTISQEIRLPAPAPARPTPPAQAGIVFTITDVVYINDGRWEIGVAGICRDHNLVSTQAQVQISANTTVQVPLAANGAFSHRFQVSSGCQYLKITASVGPYHAEAEAIEPVRSPELKVQCLGRRFENGQMIVTLLATGRRAEGRLITFWVKGLMAAQQAAQTAQIHNGTASIDITVDAEMALTMQTDVQFGALFADTGEEADSDFFEFPLVTAEVGSFSANFAADNYSPRQHRMPAAEHNFRSRHAVNSAIWCFGFILVHMSLSGMLWLWLGHSLPFNLIVSGGGTGLLLFAFYQHFKVVMYAGFIKDFAFWYSMFNAFIVVAWAIHKLLNLF